jgi:hypothetical protein
VIAVRRIRPKEYRTTKDTKDTMEAAALRAPRLAA